MRENKYLGYIKPLDAPNSWVDVGKRFPNGVLNKTIYKGLEQKSFVYLTFSGEMPWSENESVNLKTFTNAFKIKLREVLREEMGGTYGVWVPSKLSKYPNSKYIFRVIFGCDPQNVEVLTEALFNQIELVKKDGLDSTYLSKAKEMQKNEFDKNIRENKYWLSQLQSIYFNNSSPYMLNGYKELINNIETEDIIGLENQYLNMENYVKVVLYPEQN